jgi:hypothetical protein
LHPLYMSFRGGCEIPSFTTRGADQRELRIANGEGRAHTLWTPATHNPQ